LNRTAVYAGSFDPITYGHIDIIKRAAKIFDRIIVAIAHSSGKNTLFTVNERLEMLKRVTGGMKNVKIDDFSGLAVSYVKKCGSKILIRGLRAVSDFEYEFQMALTNRKLSEEIETIFLMPNESYSYLSSTLIKEAAILGADVSDFVPTFIEKQLKKKLKISDGR